MQYRLLGKTGLSVSRLAFGAGPISQLLVGSDGERQREVIAYAIERGINWFDTAATYGNGASEANLGRVLHELGAASRVQVATKVRLMPDDLSDIDSAVRRSIEASLRRLRLGRVTMLQLHNSITASRGDEPTSITPADVLAAGGVAESLARLQSEGLAKYVGFTGIGQPAAMAEVARSGLFDTLQVPYHLLNPSAGRLMETDFAETNYGNIIDACAQNGMSVFAIRVLAGGALTGNDPSPHTLTTQFFPLDLYERDRQRAAKIRAKLPSGRDLTTEAIRFALAHRQIHSAIIGFASTTQIDQAISALAGEGAALSYEQVFTLSSDQRSVQ